MNTAPKNEISATNEACDAYRRGSMLPPTRPTASSLPSTSLISFSDQT